MEQSHMQVQIVCLSPTLFPPLPTACCLSFPVFLCITDQAYLRARGEGMGEEPIHTTARKPGPL